MNDPNLGTRVADFLHKYPPFSFLPEDALLEIASKVHIKYFMEDEYLFREYDEPHDFIYVLHKGQIELFADAEGDPKLVDICDDGDIFGSRAILAGNPYSSSARVSEGCARVCHSQRSI